MLKTVESILKNNPNNAFTLQSLWWELRDESTDLDYCRKWQVMYYQMMNQIDLLLRDNKITQQKDRISTNPKM